jgi:hypothetical protein
MPAGWPPEGAPPWVMAPVMMPIYMRPPPQPLPARDRLLAGVLIGDAVLGPLSFVGLAVASQGFGGGAGSAAFRLTGALVTAFFLSIAAAPVVMRDLAGQAAPEAMRAVGAVTMMALVALAAAVALFFFPSGAGTPPTLPFATACFTASAACLLALNVLMLRTRATSMAIPALGVVFGALSLAGGLIISVVTLAQFGGLGFGAGIAAGFLVIGGFICYLIWAVLLGIAVLRRPSLRQGAAPG